MTITPADFEYLSTMLKQKIGLVLTPDKDYLLESRLLPIARSRGLANISALVERLRVGSPPGLQEEVQEAMTTNESLFFRDTKPFEHLRTTLLPAVRAQAGARRRLRLWSAAASTGQEPYSVAITLLEDNTPGWSYELIGTDIAPKVLEKATKGIYTQFEVQRGLPIQMLMKYFSPLPDTTWQVKDNVRGMISFRQQNLLEAFAPLGKFDIILCRYVLIYFDEPTKIMIVKRLAQCLEKGGFLILGGTESLMEKIHGLEPMADMRGVYRWDG